MSHNLFIPQGTRSQAAELPKGEAEWPLVYRLVGELINTT